jgi:hypothetical protein
MTALTAQQRRLKAAKYFGSKLAREEQAAEQPGSDRAALARNDVALRAHCPDCHSALHVLPRPRQDGRCGSCGSCRRRLQPPRRQRVAAKRRAEVHRRAREAGDDLAVRLAEAFV